MSPFPKSVSSIELKIGLLFFNSNDYSSITFFLFWDEFNKFIVFLREGNFFRFYCFDSRYLCYAAFKTATFVCGVIVE